MVLKIPMLSCNQRISEVKILENMVLSTIIQKFRVTFGSYKKLPKKVPSLYRISVNDAHNCIKNLSQNSILKSKYFY